VFNGVQAEDGYGYGYSYDYRATPEERTPPDSNGKRRRVFAGRG
jgi:hypothetical protein